MDDEMKKLKNQMKEYNNKFKVLEGTERENSLRKKRTSLALITVIL